MTMWDNRNFQTAITAFLLLLLVSFIYTNTKFFAKNINKRKYIFSLFLLNLLCVFAFFNDFWTLEDSIPRLVGNDEYYSGGLERIYIWIAALCNYNYLLWRFVSWSIGVVSIAFLLKHYRINNNFSLLIICCCYYWTLGYARSSIAMASFTAGFCLLSTLGKRSDFKSIAIGAIIMFASFFIHKSQAICIIAFPFLFVKKGRWFLFASLCFLPFAVELLNYGFDHVVSFIGTQSSSYYDMDLLQSKAERYLGYNKEEGYGATRLMLDFFNQLVEYILAIFIVIELSFKNKIKSANLDVRIIYTLMYVLAYFSLAAAFGGLEQSVFSYRIFNMSFYAGIICLLLMHRDKLVSSRSVMFLTLLCFGARILESLIYELYVVFS